jgi:capsular exopolysaccharide synthesis family protein
LESSREGPEFALHLRAVRRRWPLLLLVAIVTTAVALVVSLSSEKKYDATASLLLSTEEPISNVLAPGSAGSEDPERDLETAVQLITAGPTVHEVRRRLRLDDRTADDISEQVTTDTSADSDIVELTARDPDARTAANIANAFADAYTRYRVTQARERYLQAARLADQQIAALTPQDRAGEAGRTLRARRDELRITAALQTGNAQVVRRASIPKDPSRPRPLLSGVVGLVLGLALGFALALVLELVDRRLRDERSIEESYDLPVIAAIPPATREDSMAGRAQREAYGLLAANLRFSALASSSNVLVISSGGPAEGKTSVTLGVARALARLGLSVIAIEADLRRPAFASRVRLVHSTGLSGVLTGDGTLSTELVEVDADSLEPVSGPGHEGGTFRVLPAGELPGNPQRLLSGEQLGTTLHVARAMADVVLVDTAPLGTVNDPLPLLRHADGVLLVARINHSTRDAARRARRVLRGAAVELLGVVVTNAAGPGSTGMGYYMAPGSGRAAAPAERDV